MYILTVDHMIHIIVQTVWLVSDLFFSLGMNEYEINNFYVKHNVLKGEVGVGGRGPWTCFLGKYYVL